MEKLEKTNKWVACPICKDEYTKLKPCDFLWEGKWQRDNMCIQCAETTKSLEKISARYHIPGITLEKGFIGPSTAKQILQGKVYTETMFRNQYALLKFGYLTIGITASSYGPVSIKIGDEEPQTVDNILAAWSVAKKAIDKFRKPSGFTLAMFFL